MVIKLRDNGIRLQNTVLSLIFTGLVKMPLDLQKKMFELVHPRPRDTQQLSMVEKMTQHQPHQPRATIAQSLSSS